AAMLVASSATQSRQIVLSYPNSSCARPLETGQDAKQRGFAAPTWPHHSEPLALRQQPVRSLHDLRELLEELPRDELPEETAEALAGHRRAQERLQPGAGLGVVPEREEDPGQALAQARRASGPGRCLRTRLGSGLPAPRTARAAVAAGP